MLVLLLAPVTMTQVAIFTLLVVTVLEGMEALCLYPVAEAHRLVGFKFQRLQLNKVVTADISQLYLETQKQVLLEP
jgi:hypothetical protein